MDKTQTLGKVGKVVDTLGVIWLLFILSKVGKVGEFFCSIWLLFRLGKVGKVEIELFS